MNKKIILLIILFIILIITYYLIPEPYQTPYLITLSTLYILITLTISFYRRRGWI